MNQELDQLSKNLARGMSRRRALWKFAAGLGVVGLFAARKASADQTNGETACFDFLEGTYYCCTSIGNPASGCFTKALQNYSICLGTPADEPVDYNAENPGHGGNFCRVSLLNGQITFDQGTLP